MQKVTNWTLVALVSFMLTACTRQTTPLLLGNLEWDRLALPAEVSEPIIQIAVNEGDHVEANQILVELDPRRVQAQVDAAQAEIQRLEAVLQELRHGARIEQLDNLRAQLVRAESSVTNSRRDRNRAAELREKNLISQADLDHANTALRIATAEANAVRAQLAELLNGTRPEALAQAEAALLNAQAKQRGLAVQREHLSLRAPRAGRVDALPYKRGDQPPIGASLVSLLVGDAPYARIYIPESQRAASRPGMRFRVHVDGVSTPFNANLRSIRSEAAFTPYYALQGDDASRLSYRAELMLEGEAAQQLPAGLPIQAEFIDYGQP